MIAEGLANGTTSPPTRQNIIGWTRSDYNEQSGARTNDTKCFLETWQLLLVSTSSYKTTTHVLFSPLLWLHWTATPNRIHPCHLCQNAIKRFGVDNKLTLQESNTTLVNPIWYIVWCSNYGLVSAKTDEDLHVLEPQEDFSCNKCATNIMLKTWLTNTIPTVMTVGWWMVLMINVCQARLLNKHPLVITAIMHNFGCTQVFVEISLTPPSLIGRNLW